MVSASGEEFDFLDGLAASQGKFHETSVGKISFVENKLAGRGGSFLILFVVVGCFTWMDGAFSFCGSHALLTSGKRCAVRARSVLVTPGAARLLFSPRGPARRVHRGPDIVPSFGRLASFRMTI